eukprot:Nitzschia sp. Nitz4//scaffold165_size50357//38544//39767//NITZ4_007025-RA/size50357-processed-gene-0.10-mRNA-1//1//CDS//3329538144//1902//frame0
MPARILWRPIAGGTVWTGGGIGIGLIVPNVLQKLQLIESTGIVSTAFFCGCFAVLLPIGLSRGLITGVQEVVESTQPSIAKAVSSLNTETRIMTQDANSRQLVERLTFGSGWQGYMVRTLASPFLPSTSQMMVRIQEAMDKNHEVIGKTGLKGAGSSSSDGQVVAAALGGYVEGFLQDKKDTVTMLGCFMYLVVLGGGVGADYALNQINTPKPDQPESKSKPSAGSSDATTHEASWQESLDAAQVKVGEMTKVIVEKKKEMDPYLEQAAKVVEVTKDEIDEQARRLYKAAEKTVTNEDNQKLVKEKWEQLASSLEAMGVRSDEKGARPLYDDIEKFLQDAKDTLDESDFQDMKKEAEKLTEKVKKGIAEGKKFAGIDDAVESTKENMEAQSRSWARKVGDWLKGNWR